MPLAPAASRVVLTTVALIGVLGLAACGSAGAPSAASSPSRTVADATPTPTPTPTPQAPAPTAPAEEPAAQEPPRAVVLPQDCRAVLSDSVLRQLEGYPLNLPDFSPRGVQPDGSLVCNWSGPDTMQGWLTTTISWMSADEAQPYLRRLADAEGYTCYASSGGTRCEHTWPAGSNPEGRTMFWRENILIQTSYRMLAPTGYTSSIVAHLFG